MLESFSDFLSIVDRRAIALALGAKEFDAGMEASVVNILSRFGCREVPTPRNLKRLLHGLARHQFRLQPFAALCAMNAGVPETHKPFWQAVGVEELYGTYSALTANPEKVLEMVVEPEFSNPNEQRVYGYLQQYVGEMKLDEAKRFLRFITGSSVVSSDQVRICFNALTGAARRPIAHTCSNMLELSYNYNTFIEFLEEFTIILSNDCWPMNSL